MTVEASETPVEVTVEVSVPEQVEETPDAPPVVVVETETPDATDAVVLETALDHEGRIALVEVTAAEALSKANQALAIAESAIQVAAIEPEPEPIPDPEPVEQSPVEEDTAPDNEHWFFKKGWF